MFITNLDRSYSRNGEQRAKGRFLIIFSHNQYKWAEENQCHWDKVPSALSKVLYAYVCPVLLRQCGHFMMGIARQLKTHKDYGDFGSAPNFLILSGSYGGDGLPCDYEDLIPEHRKKLVLVPPDLTAQFWAGGGHNSAGSEAPAMRAWALDTFKTPPSRRKS